ncbi:MAG: PAS domain-containing protein [Herbaspirillum sp.]
MMEPLQQLIRFAEKSPAMWFAKDTDSHFLYANRAFRELLNLPRSFEVEGSRVGELPHSASEFAEEFEASERLVEATQEAKLALEIHPLGKDQVLSAYFFEHSPLFNENDEVIGTIRHAYPASNLRFNRDKIDAGVFIFGAPDDTLSKKEWDFVYFVTHGYSTKEMARLSGVSPGTMISRQNSVFNKLGIDTLAQLKQMVMAKGWDNYIPTDLLHNRIIKLW